MEFKEYQHIQKLGISEVDGILNGKCYISYKIDGTNSCVFLKDDGSLGFGSRHKEVTKDSDQTGFVPGILSDIKTYTNLLKFLCLHPNYIVYGEWLTGVYIKRYKPEAKKKFYIFDIFDFKTQKYISFDDYSSELDNFELLYIPCLAIINNPTVEDLKALLKDTGNYLITSGLGEGIVIKNYDFVNSEGNTVWTKMLTEDYSMQKMEYRHNNALLSEKYPIEYQISKMLTEEHIFKEYSKLIADKGFGEIKYMPALLNQVFIEFFKDNWEIILKKFRNPIIDFKALRSICNDKVKLVLNFNK